MEVDAFGITTSCKHFLEVIKEDANLISKTRASCNISVAIPVAPGQFIYLTSEMDNVSMGLCLTIMPNYDIFTQKLTSTEPHLACSYQPLACAPDQASFHCSFLTMTASPVHNVTLATHPEPPWARQNPPDPGPLKAVSSTFAPTSMWIATFTAEQSPEVLPPPCTQGSFQTTSHKNTMSGSKSKCYLCRNFPTLSSRSTSSMQIIDSPLTGRTGSLENE